MQGPRQLSHRADWLARGQAIQTSLSCQDARKESETPGLDDHDNEERELPVHNDGILRHGDEDTPHSSEIINTPSPPGSRRPDRWRGGTAKTIAWCRRHLRFLGPGLIASSAYIDPGNYATDLAAGAGFGYKLLFIVLFAGLVGILMQVLAARLGIVTGKDIASLCRQSLHSRKRHTLFWRWAVLYPLYIIAESAIIFTDLAELLGTATAFNLLIPQIPLWGGVLLTSLDVFIVLLAFNSYPSERRNRSITAFEILIAVLVLTVLAAFIVLLVRLAPDWSDVFEGYLPSNDIVANGALYISVGIIGATVMPHALFLGSKLGTIERMDTCDEVDASEPNVDDAEVAKDEPKPQSGDIALASVSSPRSRSRSTSYMMGPSLHMPQPTPLPIMPIQPRDESKKRSLRSIKLHVHHAQIDIMVSLFSFALVVNSAILIVAGAAFYYGSGDADTSEVQDGNLFSAFALIKSSIGQTFAYLFALALMMSGQAASITATLAGQVVSEGFIEWRTTPWKRRIITRLIGMIPSLVVSASVGQSGVNTLLVASQVTLSIVLPFVMFPLLYYTSSNQRMSVLLSSESDSVREQIDDSGMTLRHRIRTAMDSVRLSWSSTNMMDKLRAINPFGSRAAKIGTASFANNYFIMTIGWCLFCLTVIADVYALIQLGMGEA